MVSISSARRRAVAAGAVVLASVGALGATALEASSAGAATSNLFTITAVSPHRVAALTSNQVITITGTGFDEDSIDSVGINGCTDGTYIVQSATTMLFKTDDTCTTASTGVITITDTSNNTVVSVPGATGGKQALTFVAAPTISTPTASSRPVVTDNSAKRAYADQVTSASTSGGTVVRVYSGSTAFVSSATYPLSASIDGVALSSVKLVAAAGGVGQYLTGVVGPHAADAAPVLKITSNGVSKSFPFGTGGAGATAGTQDFAYAGNTVKVSPAFGPANGGNSLVISGSGFTAASTVVVGSAACTVTAHTATSLTCTVPAVPAGDVAGPVTVTVSTGSMDSVVGSGSTYTYLDA